MSCVDTSVPQSLPDDRNGLQGPRKLLKISIGQCLDLNDRFVLIGGLAMYMPKL